MTAIDYDISEFVSSSNRLKASLLTEWGADGFAATINQIGNKSYEAQDGRPAQNKLTVEFEEYADYTLECNATQTRALFQMLGDRTSQWVGQKIVLGVGKTQNPKGETVDTIMLTKYRDPNAAPAGIPPRPKPAAAPQRVPAAAVAVAEGTDPFAGE